MADRAKPVINPCDQCGRPTAAEDCAETLEEWLCEECASGCSEEDLEDYDDYDEFERYP